MKANIIIAVICFFLALSSSAQGTWQWAKQSKSVGSDNAASICTDLNGNVYIIGDFGDEMNTTPYMILDNDTVFNYGINQIYVAKYSSSGTVLWVKGIGGNNPSSGGTCNYCEYGSVIFYDSNTNSILISGNIYGTAIFGNDTLTGTMDVFLSKLDLNGNFQWAKLIYASQFVGTNSLTTDPSGNVFICGASLSTINFGSSTAPAGTFIAKYSSTGNFFWAKKEISNTTGGIPKIIFSNNSIYALGGTIINTGYIDTLHFNLGTNKNAFFSRFDTSGNVMWAKFVSSSNTAYPGDMCQDTSGNFFISGYFVTDIRFATDTLYNSNTTDLFFTKFDSSGNFLWAKQANATGGTGIGGGYLVATPDNNIYLTGGVNGSGSLGSVNISSTGSSDMYVARFNNNGICAGADVYTFNGCFTADQSGSYFIAGRLNQAITFSGTTLTPTGIENIFLAKHDAITGINTLKQSAQNNQLFIYANPNEGKCDIKVPEDFLHEKNLVLSIYDNTGKLIQQATLEMMNNGKVNLSLEQEAKGIYNVTLSNKSKTYNGKIVFE